MQDPRDQFFSRGVDFVQLRKDHLDRAVCRRRTDRRQCAHRRGEHVARPRPTDRDREHCRRRRDHRIRSSGGEERLGSILKRGNEQLRALPIVGATSIIKLGKRGLKLPDWLARLVARKPFKVVAVALAKTARVIWALLAKRGVYRKAVPAMAG